MLQNGRREIRNEDIGEVINSMIADIKAGKQTRMLKKEESREQ